MVIALAMMSTLGFLAGIVLCRYWQQANYKASQSLLETSLLLLNEQYERTGSFPGDDKGFTELAKNGPGWYKLAVDRHQYKYISAETGVGSPGQTCIVVAQATAWPVGTAVFGVMSYSPNGHREVYRFKGLHAY